MTNDTNLDRWAHLIGRIRAGAYANRATNWKQCGGRSLAQVSWLEPRLDSPAGSLMAWVQLQKNCGANMLSKPFGKSQAERELSWYVGTYRRVWAHTAVVLVRRHVPTCVGTYRGLGTSARSYVHVYLGLCAGAPYGAGMVFYGG